MAGFAFGNPDYRFGWEGESRPQDRDAGIEGLLGLLRKPTFDEAGIAISGTGAGKVVLLYKYLEKLAGQFPLRNQGQIGSCVAAGLAGAIDTLQAVEHVVGKDGQGWKRVSIEAYYGFSRVEIGGGKLGNSDGSLGSWGARAVHEYGSLTEEQIGPYDVSRCKQWGYKGVPDEYEPMAKPHCVEDITQIRSYSEARDAIANGYPVTFASNQGFSSKRDADGFCRPEGSWAHQMYGNASDDEHSRPGILVVNSWGTGWVSGPRRHDQPEGTFWADADTIDRMCRSGDCWAYAGHNGWKPRELDWRIA